MAPEQIGGKPRPASDQYTLGVVVYEWLSGDRPFHGNFTEIAVQHTVTPPPPLREKVPTILADVEQVVMVALAKEPKERFGSVQAFARALEQASQSNVVTFVNPIVPTSAVEMPRMVTPLGHPPTLPVTTEFHPQQPVGTTLYTYHAHASQIASVTWSPDSEHIASGGDDKVVQIWDATTGRSIFTCRGHTARINAVAWSPDGQSIVSAGDDRALQIWDIKTGKSTPIYRIDAGWWAWVRTVSWSPDGKYIASGDDDKVVQIVNTNFIMAKITQLSRWAIYPRRFNSFCLICDSPG